MVESATLEQILAYLRDDNQEIVIQGAQTERTFIAYELEDVVSEIYNADVIGIQIINNSLILKLDDSYGNIDTLLENPYGET